jgi:hypothetical protein
MSHILMGAIDKLTDSYCYPGIAEKTHKYICPECKKDVILRKGNIRIHHFAHYKSDNPCVYYEHPTESQIHKDAKMAFKNILDQGKNISFLRECNCCMNKHRFTIPKTNENTIIQIEHAFILNDSHKKADIAYLEGGAMKYIFEICYKHKTNEDNRPEPWFEINAEVLLHEINTEKFSNNNIQIDCIRYTNCDYCKIRESEEKEKQRLREIEEKEKQRLKEIQEKEHQELIAIRREKRSEIKKQIFSQHKRCSKCKSYERCVPCVNKLNKKISIQLEEFITNK